MKFETLRDILFMLPPETAHHLSLESIGLLRRLNLSGMVAKPVADDPVEVMGTSQPSLTALGMAML